MRFAWPSIMFSQVGQLASSKSAMKVEAPELRALITILRSVGPVISTRRSRMSLGWSATFQSASRTDFVAGRKSGILPASKSFWRSPRAASSSRRRGPNWRSSFAAKARASGVRTRPYSGLSAPVISMPAGRTILVSMVCLSVTWGARLGFRTLASPV